jgi:hypothetical protein
VKKLAIAVSTGPVRCLVASLLLAALASTATAQYPGWKHTGSVWILTTPDGANLPASAIEKDFPLLVRLHKDFFDFKQAKAGGEDLRFSTSGGAKLAYQIDEWDAANGSASVWVRVPEIQGNARQEIKLHWGKPDAVSESSGKAVFNDSNGYLGVWHLTDPAADAVGALKSTDKGTASVPGVVGKARRFALGTGIHCGDNLAHFPSGSESHTSEAWIRADRTNGRVLAWGVEKGQGKVVMQLGSPPHVRMECYFSGADVAGRSKLPMSEWVHLVHTYKKGDSRIYVNGVLDGVTTTPNAPLAIPKPAKMWIGGWYHQFNFVGDIDEVRISNTPRSANWVRLQYENQKPLQTLVGPLVQPGTDFGVAPAQATVREGRAATFYAQAGGAQKIYWTVRRNGVESIAAVDRLSFALDAGRVLGDQSLTLQFKAVYADQVKTKDIPITVKEDVPEPVFTLQAPATWNGRDTIEVTPRIANRDAMLAKNAGKLNYAWAVSGLAVIQEIAPDKLVLKRAQNSGTLTVTLALDNGGAPNVDRVEIDVKEPGRDAWVMRNPAKDEKPEDHQFFPRDDKDEGTLYYAGTLDEPADSVFVKVFVGDRLHARESQKLSPDRSYALAAKLKAGLVKYRTEFGSEKGGRETVLHTASDLVCGDAFLINGQSNAVATDVGKDDPTYTSEWIRTFGSMAGDPKNARQKRWGDAVIRARNGGTLQIGYWGMELAKRLVESQKVPICILNGAVGGTRIDEHQRNPKDHEDVATIYGRLLWRVRQAKLTHGIRGVLWHQGENDQGADGPTGRFGWETYQQFFVALSAAWKQDFPNVQHYHVFQIWPLACSMGVNGSDNMLREVQRTLPRLYSNLSVMSTLGIQPPGGCHFPPAGYAEFARLIHPLVQRDHYAKVPPASITPPNLVKAYFTSDRKNEIALEFDQPVAWKDSLTREFTLDGAKAAVTSGSVKGNVVVLQLAAKSSARAITYLDSKAWSQKNLLRGENGIAALTFCNVPILAARPPR